MAVFWVVAPSSLVEVYKRFRGPCCLHIGSRASPDPHLIPHMSGQGSALTDWFLHHRGSQTFTPCAPPPQKILLLIYAPPPQKNT
jgi:hypothetical protein